MMQLLVFKEKLRSFYGKYSIYIIPLIKFIVGMTAVYLINSNIGFMTKLKNPLVPILMGLIASFLPYGATAFFSGVLILMHVSQVSLEIALIIATIMAVMVLLYYGFRPGDGYLLLLTPMMFFFHIPYAVPLLVGLSGGIISIIPVSCGICMYYVMMYLKQNAGLLTGSSVSDMAERFIQLAKSVFGNEQMWVMAAAFAAAILIVFFIKNLSVDYSWSLAIIAGVITELVIIFIGDFNYNLTIGMFSMSLGLIVSIAIAMIYQFFVFAVDYSRTEYLQYEDDEYHYYVKAVPKIAVSEPDVKVHRIYTKKHQKTSHKKNE